MSMINQRVGNYRVLREIARGGMGVVYEAEHERIHTRVAVKVLLPYHSGDPELVERLFTEAKAVNQVDHPGLVAIQDCGQLPDGVPYLIMELMKGEPLRKLLDRGPLPAASRDLLRDVAEVMAAAHARGIVHRDLTPNNIMVLSGDGGPRIKVLDFGLAKVSDEIRSRGGARPRTAGHLGTVEYSAPEQWEDASQVSDRADVYALGVILYEALSGKLPFSGTLHQLMRQHALEPPPPLNDPSIPPELAQLCFAMLAKEPAARPPMKDVAARLRPAPPPRRALAQVGNFRLGKVLGQGAYGTVHEATHEHLNERRAVKLLRPGAPELTVQRFFNEARSASKARHPGIVEIFDCGTAGDQAYLIMELVPDGSLRDLLDRHEAPPLSVYQQIAEAMAEAHRHGIVHRDLKPDNVLLRREGGGRRAKVGDFGIAKLDEAHFGSVVKRVKSNKGQPLGTPRYMAPEQWMDATEVTDRADVYSLGVMLYEGLSGALPFQGGNQLALMMQHLKDEPPRLKARGAPPALVELVHRMLAKDPAQRPSMAEVAQALRPAPEVIRPQVQAPVKVLVEPAAPAPIERAEDTSKVPLLPQRRMWPFLLAGGGASGALALFVLLWHTQDPTPRPPPIKTDVAAPALAPPIKVKVRLQSKPPGAEVYDSTGEKRLGTTEGAGLELELEPGRDLQVLLKKAAYKSLPYTVRPDKPDQLAELEEEF